jgi:hypothetical protein
MPLMLSVTYMSLMLSVIMLRVVILSIVAPFKYISLRLKMFARDERSSLSSKGVSDEEKKFITLAPGVQHSRQGQV